MPQEGSVFSQDKATDEARKESRAKVVYKKFVRVVKKYCPGFR